MDAQVLAISTDDLRGAETMAERLGLPFPILYDPPAEVVKQYEVFNLLGDGLATSSTFIIDKDGVIRWKFVANHYTQHPSGEEVVEQLQPLES